MTDDTDERNAHGLEIGELYWDTDRWKTYAPYRTDDELVYLVTVRHKSEIEDALSTGLLVRHDESLSESDFEAMEALDSFRSLPEAEATALAERRDGDDD